MTFWERSAEKRTAIGIIHDYVRETGNRAFTYTDLRTWYYSSGAHKRYRRDWHTVERLLRKLAEDGYLLRYRYKRTVRFLLPANCTEIAAIVARYRDAQARGDYQTLREIVRTLMDQLGVDEYEVVRLLRGWK